MPHTFTLIKNFYCPYGQEKLFEELERSHPEIFSEILSKVEDLKNRFSYDVVVTLYHDKGKDHVIDMAKSLDTMKNESVSITRSIRSYHEELAWETENLSVTIA